jgi:hypothetical protein
MVRGIKQKKIAREVALGRCVAAAQGAGHDAAAAAPLQRRRDQNIVEAGAEAVMRRMLLSRGREARDLVGQEISCRLCIEHVQRRG